MLNEREDTRAPGYTTRQDDKRLYDNVHWRKARAIYLRNHPLCVICQRSKRTTPATIVDHIKPHNGDHDLFWDTSNWQALCASCHSGVKRITDKDGYNQMAGKNGMPLDPSHPWNTGKGDRRGGSNS